jgi:WD40 repeat protein
VAFTRDGRRLAAVGTSIRLWETRTWDPVRTFGDAGRAGSARAATTCVAFTPDGTRMATGDVASRVTVWDVATGRSLRTLEGIEPAFYGPASPRLPMRSPAYLRAVGSLAVSPDGALLAAGYGPAQGFTRNYDQRVKVFELGSGAVIATLPVANTVSWLHFTPDGSSLMAACQDGMVMRWGVRGWGPAAAPLAAGAPITAGAVSPDGSKLAVGLSDGKAVVWELASRRELHRASGHSGAIFGIAFSADGRTLATSSGLDQGSVKFWDVATGGELLSVHVDAAISGLAFSPAGDLLAGAAYRGVRIWTALSIDQIDAATLARRARHPGSEDVTAETAEIVEEEKREVR